MKNQQLINEIWERSRSDPERSSTNLKISSEEMDRLIAGMQEDGVVVDREDARRNGLRNYGLRFVEISDGFAWRKK